MKTKIILLALLILFIASISSTRFRIDKVKEKELKLVWSDEFNYNGVPDSSKWGFEEGYIRGTEKQYYTKNREKNARVANGYLYITALRENFKNSSLFKRYDPIQLAAFPKENLYKYDSLAHYTSASLITLNKASWKYGRIEVRAKLPFGAGVWPAIWMVGTDRAKVHWPKCGEIDIMEFVGKDPLNIHANVHYPDTLSKVRMDKDKSKSLAVGNLSEQFHTYAIEWNNKTICFFLDDKLYHSFDVDEAGADTNNVFRKPFYLIINLALGGIWGGQIDDNILPQQFIIDYVRVYQ